MHFGVWEMHPDTPVLTVEICPESEYRLTNNVRNAWWLPQKMISTQSWVGSE